MTGLGLGLLIKQLSMHLGIEFQHIQKIQY